MGHFLTARLTKMKVEEFGIGIPPRAKKLFSDKKWTDYTLNWLPIGWFVRIKGEDSSSLESSDSDSFSAKKWWARSLVLIAWVAMNFILAWFIFTGLFWHGSSPLAVNFLLPSNYGSYFLPSIEESFDSGFLKHEGIELEPLFWGPAEKNGIVKGDILQKVNNTEVKSIEELMWRIKENLPMEFTILKHTDGSVTQVSIVPIDGRIQAFLRYSDLKISKDIQHSTSFPDAIKKWLRETIILSLITFDFLGKVLHDLIQPDTPEDRELAKEMLAWPIGMWAGMVELVQVGFTMNTLLLMIAFLSINLWVLNILPFPALDGGRLFSTTLVTIISFFTKRKQSLQKIEQTFHALWMLLLIFLSLLIAFHDILKL
jgi:regulator of sigma E protease